MKTGAARLALSAAARLGCALPIIPVGVIYRDAPTFRSEAGVVVGDPIAWQDLAQREPGNRVAAQELTDRIGAGLATVTRDLDSGRTRPWSNTRRRCSPHSLRPQAPPWVSAGERHAARMDADQTRRSHPPAAGRAYARAAARPPGERPSSQRPATTPAALVASGGGYL
jgi:hypothetical protein